MNRVWAFPEKVDTYKEQWVLPANEAVVRQLRAEFSSLSIARPPYQPFGSLQYEGAVYASDTGAHPENLFYVQVKSHPVAKTVTGITEVSFEQAEARLVKMNIPLRFVSGGSRRCLRRNLHLHLKKTDVLSRNN